MIQSVGFLGRFLGPLITTWLPLMKNVIKPLAKSVLIPLGLTAAASAADARIHKKILGPGHHPSSSASHNRFSSSASHSNTMQIISNDEMKEITRIVNSLEDFGLLLKGVSQRIQNEAKEQKGGFLSMLLGTLGANSLGNVSAGKGRTGDRPGEGIIRAGYGNKRQDHKNKMDF